MRGPALALVLLGSIGCGGAEDGARVAETGPASAPLFTRAFSPELRAAVRALEEKRYETGRELVEAYLAAHPEDAQATLLLGMSFYWTGNYGAARPLLAEVLEREPELHAAREAFAYSLLLLGELGPARREYERYAAAMPGDPKGHYGLGLIELEETRLDEAADRFRRAIALFAELAPRDPRQGAARAGEYAECHARLGEVHFARGELEAARAELLRATAISPGNISAFYTLGLVHRRLGEEELADQAAARYESARQALLAQQRARGE